ncbi:MAG TPA: hypothetical protein PKA64_06650 [Myxococcota bacterium]|nr:hypothetical protein [Myxococcota bacterium]
MRTLSEDTSPEAEAYWIERPRALTPEQRLQMVAKPNDQLRALVTARILAEAPDLTPEQLRRRVAATWLGPELARQVFGGDP